MLMFVAAKDQIIRFFTKSWVKRIVVMSGFVSMLLGLVIVVRSDLVFSLGLLGLWGYSLIGPATILVPSFAVQFGLVPVALVAAWGMAINDSIGWVVGKNADIFVRRPWYVIKAEGWLRRYGIIGLFLFSIIPFPYDFIAVAAGYVEIPFGRYITTIFLARLVRFVLLGSGALVILK